MLPVVEETQAQFGWADQLVVAVQQALGLGLVQGLVDRVDAHTDDTRNPGTGEVIAKVSASAPKDAALAVNCSSRALDHEMWSKMDAADRGRLIFNLADRIEQEAGELALLDQEARSATVEADEDLVCYVLDRASFDKLTRQDPAIAINLLSNLGRELASHLRRANRTIYQLAS